MLQNKIPYTRVKYWADQYGKSGAEDKHAVEEFMICESTEAVNSLRTELIAMSQGNFDNQILDLLVGVKRRVKFSGFDGWAKMMLLWMAAFKG